MEGFETGLYKSLELDVSGACLESQHSMVDEPELQSDTIPQRAKIKPVAHRCRVHRCDGNTLEAEAGQ